MSADQQSTLARLQAIADGESGADPAWAEEATMELRRLYAAVEFCRPRLKLDGYRETLDRILRGDKDEQIRNPDLTPVALSEDQVRALMRDPRYWRDRDPDTVARVAAAFRSLCDNG